MNIQNRYILKSSNSYSTFNLYYQMNDSIKIYSKNTREKKIPNRVISAMKIFILKVDDLMIIYQFRRHIFRHYHKSISTIQNFTLN